MLAMAAPFVAVGSAFGMIDHEFAHIRSRDTLAATIGATLRRDHSQCDGSLSYWRRHWGVNKSSDEKKQQRVGARRCFSNGRAEAVYCKIFLPPPIGDPRRGVE